METTSEWQLQRAIAVDRKEFSTTTGTISDT